MKMAAEELTQLANELCGNEHVTIDEMKYKFLSRTEAMLIKDIADNRAIGEFGATAILAGITGNVRVLTHCNTGSLATAGYGTALGVVRRLHELGRLEHVYCTETRPYNQGARLTAFELVHDKLPATLIVDSMVAALMKHKVQQRAYSLIHLLSVSSCCHPKSNSILYLGPSYRTSRRWSSERIVLSPTETQPTKLALIKSPSCASITMCLFTSLHR